MNCNEVLASYSDYIDGELWHSARQEFENHLSLCEKCNNYHSILSIGLEEFQNLPDIELDDHFYLRLQHRILHLEEEERAKTNRLPIFKALRTSLAPTLSAIAVFAFVVFFFAPKISFNLNTPVVPENTAKTTSNLTPQALENPTEEIASNNSSETNNFNAIPTTSLWSNNNTSHYSSPGTVSNLMFINWRFSNGSSFSKRYYPLFLQSKLNSPTTRISSKISNSSNYRVQAISKLGIFVTQYLEEHLSEELAALDNSKGLYVEKVAPFSSAFIGGLVEGDIITSFEGYPVKSSSELTNLIKSSDWGIKRLGLIRDGRKIEVYIFL